MSREHNSEATRKPKVGTLRELIRTVAITDCINAPDDLQAKASEGIEEIETLEAAKASKAELKKVARRLRLKVTGTKAALMERIISDIERRHGLNVMVPLIEAGYEAHRAVEPAVDRRAAQALTAIQGGLDLMVNLDGMQDLRKQISGIIDKGTILKGKKAGHEKTNALKAAQAVNAGVEITRGIERILDGTQSDAVEPCLLSRMQAEGRHTKPLPQGDGRIKNVTVTSYNYAGGLESSRYWIPFNLPILDTRTGRLIVSRRRVRLARVEVRTGYLNTDDSQTWEARFKSGGSNVRKAGKITQVAVEVMSNMTLKNGKIVEPGIYLIWAAVECPTSWTDTEIYAALGAA